LNSVLRNKNTIRSPRQAKFSGFFVLRVNSSRVAVWLQAGEGGAAFESGFAGYVNDSLPNGTGGVRVPLKPATMMKTKRLISPLVYLLFLGLPLQGQDEQAPAAAAGVEAKVTAELSPNQQAFLNLPEESRKTFIKHIEEATRVFQQKRIFETLEELEKAAKIFKDSPELHNLRGSCYVEMRSFEKALAEFHKALAFAKDNPSVEFNIGEVYFVTKEWQKALDIFEKIIKKLPPENLALGRLVEFKMLLCLNKLGKKDEVTILSEKYDFLDDSPFYYYAQAALAYEAQDLIKAEEWLARAGRIFQDPNVLAPWQDTLVEYGYIKSFYGEEAAADE
jgi:Tfp pilus assembly protein PilF